MQLAISFERKHRIALYTPRGEHRSQLPLPETLSLAANYTSPNKGLEALTYHSTLGWLAAPEWPLQGADRINIAALAGAGFEYPRYPASGSALVAMEAMADGSLLTLDRSFNRATASLIVALRRTEPLAGIVSGATLAPQPLAVFDSYGDWAIDNFEGLTKHREDRVFVVSDNNQSFLQRTIVLYLALERP